MEHDKEVIFSQEKMGEKKCTVEPHYDEVGYITKSSYNKVILLVPALYIFFIQWNLFITRSLGL